MGSTTPIQRLADSFSTVRAQNWRRSYCRVRVCGVGWSALVSSEVMCVCVYAHAWMDASHPPVRLPGERGETANTNPSTPPMTQNPSKPTNVRTDGRRAYIYIYLSVCIYIYNICLDEVLVARDADVLAEGVEDLRRVPAAPQPWYVVLGVCGYGWVFL